MKDYGNGIYQVRLSNGQIKNVPVDWMQEKFDTETELHRVAKYKTLKLLALVSLEY